MWKYLRWFLLGLVAVLSIYNAFSLNWFFGVFFIIVWVVIITGVVKDEKNEHKKDRKIN